MSGTRSWYDDTPMDARMRCMMRASRGFLVPAGGASVPACFEGSSAAAVAVVAAAVEEEGCCESAASAAAAGALPFVSAIDCVFVML